MNDTSILDLATSGRLLSEGLHGVLKANPDDTTTVLFSEAFSPQPDGNVFCHWVAVPKDLIAYVQPLGTGYCCEPQGVALPMPSPYVRLWLAIPQDPAGAALAQLLGTALKNSSKQGTCGCYGSRASDYPWPVYNCPASKVLLSHIYVRPDNLGGDSWRWTPHNDNDDTVHICPRFTVFVQSGQGVTIDHEYCQGYDLVQGHSDSQIYYETTWNEGTSVGTKVTIWDSYFASGTGRQRNVGATIRRHKAEQGAAPDRGGR